jgi:hypothetical protein
MDHQQNISVSRRRFLNTGFKLAALSAFVLPFQKALAAGTAVIATAKKKFHEFLWIDKLVLNSKTGVVHLPSGKIFSKYPTIRRQAIIGNADWEIQVKPPYHFHKEKSGVILEVLALSRLASGINDRSLTDAYRILSIAFTGTYRDKSGLVFNKYNFRLHHLLLNVISLKGNYPLSQKLEKFQLATGRINYALQDKRPIPRSMEWIKTKAGFDKKANYIIQNKTLYTDRLAKRASQFKL